MAASDDNSRRAAEAERVRHIAGAEARAFTATAVTMLLGVLAEAEAAEHRKDPPAVLPETGHAHDQLPAPAPVAPEAGPAGPPAHEAAPAEQHTDAGATDTLAAAPMVHGTDSGAGSAELGIAASSPALTETAATHSPSPLVGDAALPAEHGLATTEGATPTDGASALSPEPFPQPQPTQTVTGLIDNSLTALSHSLAGLTASIGQLTTSISETVTHLTGGLIASATHLLHDVPVSGVVDSTLTDVLGSHTMTTEPASTAAPIPLLDSAGTVPVAPLHPMPLQLGFLGQPTSDGHDLHDGAFSALGIHHF